MDYWLDMALAVMFSTLKQVIKNPVKKAELKKAMLKLRDNINIAYAGDVDFIE